jgi:hypothetical protein
MEADEAVEDRPRPVDKLHGVHAHMMTTNLSSDMPDAESTLTGGCLCGGVRFELTEPFTTAGYCHCTHCQRRTGTAVSLNGRLPRSGLRVTSGEDLLESFLPAGPGTNPKVFCRRCGSHLFSGDLHASGQLGIRFGVLDRDPGIRPEFRQWVAAAPAWEPIPDDGLPRFDGPRTA